MTGAAVSTFEAKPPGPRQTGRGGATPLGDILKRVSRTHGLSKQGQRARAAAAWAKAVGPELAAHCWVALYRAGRVTVVVDSAALHMELASLRAPAVLEDFRREAGDLRVDGIGYRIAAKGEGRGA